MRVASKIAIGSGIAIVLLMAVLAWDLSLVDRLAGVNQDLSGIDFRASRITLQQARVLNEIDEFSRKYEVTGDTAYADRLGGLRATFAGHLAELGALDLSPAVRIQVGELARRWDAYWRRLARFPTREPAPTENWHRSELLAGLSDLQEQLERVSEAARWAVADQASASAAVSERARRVSWTVVGAAVILSFVILWFTIRSINRPLTQLARGTQAVADGEFSVELETRGRDELARLAESFNLMVRRLGEAERAKKEFLSHVSHELKTPLASMQETNELLLEEIPGTLNAKQKRFLTLNLDSSRRLSAMISKLLDLSRLDAGAMDYDFKREDLVALTRTVVAGFEARARDQGLRVSFQTPVDSLEVDCDRDRIIQVIENLIDNALKFSPYGGSIEVRVLQPNGNVDAASVWAGRGNESPISSEIQMAVIEVADSGPGVPDDKKRHIFRRFQQIKSSLPGQPGHGVGLGLTICREIAEAHNGAVGVRDNGGQGSVFTLALPAVQAAEAERSEKMWEEHSIGA